MIPTPSQIALGNELPCEAAHSLGQRALVAGCGYLGLAAARLLHALGWEVIGITRSRKSARALEAEPFPVTACDIADRAGLAALGRFDTVIGCASSGQGGAAAYRQVYLEGMQSLIDVVRPPRFVFTSSTSVYAQTDGGVVTEESPAEPARETGQILRAAEALVLAAGGKVARLGGIYGPERWALLENFLAGRAVIEGNGSRFLNSIHRADAASALAFLLNGPLPPGIYNVVDDHPLAQREAYAVLAEHFHRPLPPGGPPDFNGKRGWTHKQVSNAKLRALGWTPLYPSLRDALPPPVRL